MLAEQNVGQGQAKFWWGGKSFATDLDVTENAIASALREKGFTVVDRRLLQGKVTVTPAITSAEPTDQAIKEFATKSGAEIVFVGKAIAVDAGTVLGTPMHSLQATMSMRALSLDDARILASGATTQVAAHVDALTGGAKALQKAAVKAMDDMLPKILDSLRAKKVKVVLTLKKLKDFKQLRKLEASLRAIADVAQLTERRFENQIAEIEIEFQGTASTLATRMGEQASLKITATTPNTVTAEVE